MSTPAEICSVERHLLKPLIAYLSGILGAGVVVGLFSLDRAKTPRVLLTLSGLTRLSLTPSMLPSVFSGTLSLAVESQREVNGWGHFDLVGRVRAAMTPAALGDVAWGLWQIGACVETATDNETDTERGIDSTTLNFNFQAGLTL
jgi:hypothetical protein